MARMTKFAEVAFTIASTLGLGAAASAQVPAAQAQQSSASATAPQPTQDDIDAIMKDKGYKANTPEKAREIFLKNPTYFEQQRKFREEDQARKQKAQEAEEKFVKGGPLIGMMFDTVKGGKNPEPTALQSAVDQFVGAGAVIHWTYDYDVFMNGRRDQEQNPIALLGIAGGIPPYNGDGNPGKTTLEGTKAIVTLLDVLEQAKSKTDKADPRQDGIVSIQNALHDALAKMECPKPVGERQVSAAWAAQACPAPAPGQ